MLYLEKGLQHLLRVFNKKLYINLKLNLLNEENASVFRYVFFLNAFPLKFCKIWTSSKINKFKFLNLDIFFFNQHLGPKLVQENTSS